MDTRNALGIASPQDRQFARRAKAAVEDTTAYQNLKHMLTGPIDQMSDLYTVLQGKGDAATEDRIVGRVGEGLMGMGLFTKNGIPHNDFRVMDSYIKNIENGFGGTGLTPRVVAKEWDQITGRPRIKMRVSDGTKDVAEVNRKFHEEGIEAEFVKSLLPDNQRSGVLEPLYNADRDFIEKYGGELWGDFVNKRTAKKIKDKHPDANVTSLYGPKNEWLGDRVEAKYPGLLDFPVGKYK